jgi:cyclophilin family peptidyl-prolyl cis-trans isomerase
LSSNQSSGGLDYKARLTEFYQKHNPSKVDTVDATLAKYKGKEEDLFQKLKAKYEGSSTSADKSGFALPSGEGPLCFLKFSVNGKPAGRVVVKLFQDKTPLAAENFKCLCTGEKGMGRLGKPLCYKNSQVHRIVPNFCVQMGDFTKGNGTGGESIYSPNSEHGDAWGKFKDEAFMQHSKPGLLSMANSGKNTNSSQVFFTLRAVPYLDGKHVVFGEVVEGMDVIESLGKLETNAKQNPVQPVEIMECGEVVDGTDVPSQQPKQSSPFLNPSSMFSLSAPVSAFGSTGSSAFGTAGSNLSSTGSPFGFGNSFASTSLFGQSQPTIKPVSEASGALQQQPSSQATTSGALKKANSGAFPPSSSKAPTPFGQGKLILSLMAILASALILPVSSFLPGKKIQRMSRPRGRFLSTQQFLFDKLFEEEGVLGKGVTVGKISVALRSPDRSDTSIFGLLESHAADDSDANENLARMANNVCLDLMRKSDDWVAACSSSKWFSGKDAGKAESYYNDLSNNEAVKFEKVRRKCGSSSC